MKTKLLSLVAVFGIAFGLSTSSLALGIEDVIAFAAKSAPDAFCKTGVSPLRKAHFLCDTNLGAAIALIMCKEKNLDNFMEGQCGKKALAKIGEREPMVVFKEEAEKKGAAAKAALCKAIAWAKKSGFITKDPGGLIAKICPPPAE